MEQESSDERGDSVRVDTDKESAFIERRKLVAQFHRHLNYSVFGLSLLAIPVGIAAAYGAWAFGAAVGSLGFLFRGESTVIGNVFHLIELATAGLLFGIVLHFLKWERFRTPAHVIVASAENGGRMRLRDGFITSVADATALALAAPVGRYGPAVNLGATIGSVFGQWMRLGETSVRILLGCGVAGAISAAFNAPIAGVIFAHEVIIGHFKLRAFAPVTLASVAAVAVTRHHGIEYEALKLPSALHPVTPEDYPIFLGLGFFMALVAMVYMSGIVGAAGVARRLRIPKWLQPMIGGTLAG
ncbi:MAG: chloride channel protein, partial [Verrucomicrobiota bacterium]